MTLFDAVATRDAAGMAASGKTILDAAKGPPSETTEFAFLAAATGFMCRGEPERARILLEKADTWVRAGQRLTERRYLAALLNARRDAKCSP